MAEHKGDELSATGSHRAWSGETTGPVVRAGAPRDPQRNWLDRAHPSPQQPVNSRHAAITRSLNTWSNARALSRHVIGEARARGYAKLRLGTRNSLPAMLRSNVHALDLSRITRK